MAAHAFSRRQDLVAGFNDAKGALSSWDGCMARSFCK